MRKKDWEEQALLSNPFEGDFGSGEVVLSKKIVTAAKDNMCCGIAEPCERRTIKGDRCLTITEADGYGRVRTYRWCEECSEQHALSVTGQAKWQRTN